MSRRTPRSTRTDTPCADTTLFRSDAMAVGVTLAFLDVHILVTALAIGLATFVMATIGIMVGRIIGGKFGLIAEVLGSLGLILIGTKILIKHTLLDRKSTRLKSSH